MPFDSLRDYLHSLEQIGELKRVKAPVDPMHELGAIAYHSLIKKGPALVFENIKGHRTPLVTNVLSTDRKVAVALGIEGDMRAMFEKFLSGFKNPIVPVEVKAGPCKEEIYKDGAVDITKFPTPVWHEKDAGPYLGTFHGCITKDRATGDQNMGMYRLL
ncbi:MAG TPA: UbiD family decarboxylase, partial [Candidatus Binatia bacterium]|nr:UbiD family decarboxylase [Candidatus Binatia bacterium]